MKLYTTGCPRCRVLESKLDAANLKYETVTDVDEMQRLGMASAPWLEVNGELLDFNGALKWLRKNAGAGRCTTCDL